jgi:hypothetical protein
MIIDAFRCSAALGFVSRRSFAPRLVINYHFLITQMMNPFSRFDSLPFFRGAILSLESDDDSLVAAALRKK